MLRDGSLARKITAEEALFVLERVQCIFALRCGRVRWMRMIAKPLEWMPCYRNQAAPVLQPSIEWVLTREYRKCAPNCA